VWFSFFRKCTWVRLLPKHLTSTSFTFLQSLTQLTLAASPQRNSSSPELLFPSAQVRVGDPLFGRLPPLPTLRLPGLATRLTAYSLRLLVSFVSHSPRSWDLPLRSLTSREMLPCFHRNSPTCCFFHTLRKQQPLARRCESQLLGFTPRQKPLRLTAPKHSSPE
jgi:hypothetical protein